jgi:hypothetical protein
MEQTMRIFSCFTYLRDSSVPLLALILARDEARARLLARRECSDRRDALCVELREHDRLVWREAV